MSNAYDELVRSGFVGSLKRDVLLEASRDLEYVGGIRQQFADAGAAAARDPDACAVTLIRDLTTRGLCSLATWSSGYGSDVKLLDAARSDLEAIVAASVQRDNVFQYFLVATEAGKNWVRRYDTLVDEL